MLLIKHARPSPVAIESMYRIPPRCRHTVNTHTTESNPLHQPAAKIITSLAVTATLLVAQPHDAIAATTQKLAEFGTSGLIPVPGVFKDTVQVLELEDPGVDGVVIYFTDYNRSVVERLGSDPFSDPSQSSLACIATAGINIKDPSSARGSEGQEIFSQLKSLNPVANILQNRRTNIRRVWDEKNQTLVYVAYSSRFTTSSSEGGVSSSRYRTSMCAVRAPPPGADRT